MDEKHKKKLREIKKTPLTVNNKIMLPTQWPYRLIGNALIIGIIIFLSSIAHTIKNDVINKQIISIQDSFYRITSRLGFTVEDIIVEGRKYTSTQDILKASKLSRNSNIIEIDLKALKERIEELPWIKEVKIKKSYYPHIIQISIKERKVKCLWQLHETFYPIDEDGNIINTSYTPKTPLLLIIGSEAPKNINTLLKIIEKDKELYSKVKVAIYISKRRWNIILNDITEGITIKLPEKGVEESWNKLIKLNKSKNILKRKLTNIDLRLKGKIIIEIEKSGRKTPLSKIKENKV